MDRFSCRPSGVPGLFIIGESRFRNFSLYAVVGDDSPVLPVMDMRWMRQTPTGPRIANEWDTVREAKAAAERIRDLLPWGTPDLLPTVRADLDRYRREIYDALTKETRP